MSSNSKGNQKQGSPLKKMLALVAGVGLGLVIGFVLKTGDLPLGEGNLGHFLALDWIF